MLDSSSPNTASDERWKMFGFLIADLFMALALVFLLLAISARADASSAKNQIATQTAQKATLTAANATVTAANATLVAQSKQVPCLDTTSVLVILTVDPQSLLGGSAVAKDTVIQQIQARKDLQGRRAGLVIAYGGAPTPDGISRAEQVAAAVNNTLSTLNQPGKLFYGTAYHPPLFLLGADQSRVSLEIYLYHLYTATPQAGGGSCA